MKLFVLSSWVAVALTGLASSLGLAADGIYRDNPLVRAAWRGNDLVTLCLVVPLLVAALVRVGRGSSRALLFALGALAYAAYNYAFYLFGAAFNGLFLVYVGILSSSTLGLIGGLASGRVRAVVEGIRVRTRDRWVGGLVVLVSLVLGLFWVATSLAFLATGAVPAPVTATDHPTNVTGALDLWLVVTFGLLGGTLLLRRRAWGFVIAAVWTVKGALYMTALSAASVSAVRVGAADSLAQLGLWVPIGVACLVGAGVLLGPGRLPGRLPDRRR